jgi:hypothetical protein
MTKAKAPGEPAARVAKHRSKMLAEGSARVEVTVPAQDVDLMKALARALRDGGDKSWCLRCALRDQLSPMRATTGAELVEFLRSAPLTEELPSVRERSTGRSADFD